MAIAPYLLSILSGVAITSCDVDPTKRDSKQNFIVTEDYYSMNLEEANENIFKTNVMILIDVANKKGLIIYKGEVIESFPILRGMDSDWNVSGTETPLGLFTVHGIDYCPPWNSAPNDEAKVPCSKSNRLGGGAFWFRGEPGQGEFVYAFHTRHPDDRWEFSQSKELRDGSRGCVVASDTIITKLFELIFLDPAFILTEGPKAGQLHDAAKQITKYLNLNNEDKPPRYIKGKNIYMTIQDSEKGSVLGTKIPTYIGPPVKIDIKVLVMDLNNPKITLSSKQLEPQKALTDLITSDSSPEENSSRFLATNCLVTKKTSIHSVTSSSAPDNPTTLSVLSPGDKLIGVYRHSLRLSDPVTVEFWDPRTKKAQEGQIKDSSSLKCNIHEKNMDQMTSDSCDDRDKNSVKTKSYWSENNKAKILKCS